MNLEGKPMNVNAQQLLIMKRQYILQNKII